MLIMLLALFLVTMFLGTPIAFSMSFASIVTNLTHGASSLMLTAQQCYDSTSNLSLLAVPFFMLAGSIMNMGGISRRLSISAGCLSDAFGAAWLLWQFWLL